MPIKGHCQPHGLLGRRVGDSNLEDSEGIESNGNLAAPAIGRYRIQDALVAQDGNPREGCAEVGDPQGRSPVTAAIGAPGEPSLSSRQMARTWSTMPTTPPLGEAMAALN